MRPEARWEYFRTIYGRYQKGDRKARQAILNEFCLNTGYHRKYAIRLLNGRVRAHGPAPRGFDENDPWAIFASYQQTQGDYSGPFATYRSTGVRRLIGCLAGCAENLSRSLYVSGWATRWKPIK